jgi:anti-sigma B factor antagonist
VRVQLDEPGRRVTLAGRLDAGNVADARRVLHDELERGTGDLVVCLADVDVGDATVLGLLVGVHRRAGRLDRRLVLAEVPDRVYRLLVLTRLHRVLVVIPSSQVA